MPALPLRLCLALLMSAQASLAVAETVTLDLTFSERALAELTQQREGVVVVAYFSGEPIEGATLPETDDGTIFLMSEEITLHPGPAQLVLGHALATAPLEQVTEPMLNVNVVSARWISEINLLACEFLDGEFAELAAAPQKIHCKLIEE